VKLEQSFEVAAPIDRVWAALIDLEQVAPCLPGAAISGRDDAGTYHGEFTVKLGPTTANYRGTVKIESADEDARTATLAARGSDKRGQGGASATIVNTLAETEGGGTRVDAVTDFTITGRLASFGRGGMIKDISNRLMRDFASCLQARLEAAPAAAGEAPAASAEEAAATAGTTPAAGGITAEEAAASAGAADQVEAAPAQPGPPPAEAPAQPPPPAAAPPVKGFSLLFSVLWERIRGLLSVLWERVGNRLRRRRT
jgi:carbon monoxide dehydrogenase subunit G